MMATKAKRLKVGDASDILQDFLQWSNSVGLILSNKVYVSTEGTVADYGMLAKEDIEEGEVLFTIPRSALLHLETTKVSALLKKEKSSLVSSSGWVPLLLALLYESTSPQSHWKPYLSLWPDFKALDHPMFWSEEERDELLKGTGIPEAVATDVSNIQREYADIVLPFIRRHPELWDPNTHTLELYMQLVAFVMAYSFQEPQEEDDEEQEAPAPPMMVPMADMLNHVSNHNANLEFHPDSLKMVSLRRVREGEELFNTYGQMANMQLLHMYGFTEPYQDNSNDTADIPVCCLYQAAARDHRTESQQQLFSERSEVLDNNAVVFGKHGCLTDSELHSALKLLCMSQDEFSDFKDNEGWEEDDEDEDEEEISRAFSNEGLPGLKAPWKRWIHEAARLVLASYGDAELESDRLLMENGADLKGRSSRRWRALQVRLGQKTILHQLLELTAS